MSETLLAGRYRLGVLIGVGGAARVHVATDTVLGVERAVKVLDVGQGEERAHLRKRLQSEARVMAALDHPHVLRVYDLGHDQGHDFVVMELARRGSLAWRLQTEGPLPFGEVATIGVQVLSALEAAHGAGIIHRDVKPQNILDVGGRVQLADFGIALISGPEVLRVTRTGMAMGSLAYMAPEQRVDASRVGPTADVYALGATLYALSCNLNPVDLFLVGEGSSRWDPVPPALRPVLIRATRLDPADRYASAAAMARALCEAVPEARGPLPEVPLESDPDWLSHLGTGGKMAGLSGFKVNSAQVAPTRQDAPIKESNIERRLSPGWLGFGVGCLLLLLISLLGWEQLVPTEVSYEGLPEALRAQTASMGESEAAPASPGPMPTPPRGAANDEVVGNEDAGKAARENEENRKESRAVEVGPGRAPRGPLLGSPRAPTDNAEVGQEAPNSREAPGPTTPLGPVGRWQLNINGRPGVLILEGEDREGELLVRGRVERRSSGIIEISAVVGRYQPAGRLLELEEREGRGELGNYRLNLSSDLERLEGSFQRRSGGESVRITGARR